MTPSFEVVIESIVTYSSDILLVRANSDFNSEFTFPKCKLETNQDPEKFMEDFLTENLGIENVLHQIVDVSTSNPFDNSGNLVRIVFHFEAKSKDINNDLNWQEIKWVDADKLKDSLGPKTCKILKDRENINDFIERVRKAPY